MNTHHGASAFLLELKGLSIMAEQVLRTCDASTGRKGNCGERVPDDTAFRFSIGDTVYEADLCVRHREDFSAKVQTYVDVARPVTTRAGKAVRQAIRGRKGVFTTKDVREWLREQGVEVAESGRLPNEHIQKYREAHT